MKQNKVTEPELLVCDNRGIYIPQLFCQNYASYITNLEEVKEDFDTVLLGPDNEDYFDAWDSLLNRMKFTNDYGQMFEVGYLEDSGDLWAIPEGYTGEEDSSYNSPYKLWAE